MSARALAARRKAASAPEALPDSDSEEESAPTRTVSSAFSCLLGSDGSDGEDQDTDDEPDEAPVVMEPDEAPVVMEPDEAPVVMAPVALLAETGLAESTMKGKHKGKNKNKGKGKGSKGPAVRVVMEDEQAEAEAEAEVLQAAAVQAQAGQMCVQALLRRGVSMQRRSMARPSSDGGLVAIHNSIHT